MFSMKRIIKFRGLRVDGKGWVYGDLVSDGKDSKNNLFWIFPEDANEYSFDLFVKVTPESIGQFIKKVGVLDLYQGDKLKGDEDNLSCYSVVEWDDKNGKFIINDYGYSISYGEGSQEIIGNDIELCDTDIYDIEDISSDEIIGNIHQP